MVGMKRSSSWDLFPSDGLLIFYKSCEVLSNYCFSLVPLCVSLSWSSCFLSCFPLFTELKIKKHFFIFSWGNHWVLTFSRERYCFFGACEMCFNPQCHVYNKYISNVKLPIFVIWVCWKNSEESFVMEYSLQNTYLFVFFAKKYLHFCIALQ